MFKSRLFQRLLSWSKSHTVQTALPIPRPLDLDRNHHAGGRSFYFFDFDDNVAFLTTPIILFHKVSGVERHISSAEYAQNHHLIGLSGVYKDYEMNFDDSIGTFRNFRDKDFSLLKKFFKTEPQAFILDLAHVLGLPDFEWKGPSWDTFYHAVYNQRPLSVITARGHHPNTMKQGIKLLVREGHLPCEPNYLSVFPVTHPMTRLSLGDLKSELSVASLKQRAIRASVEMALELYGTNVPHRFGMSDDDPKNIQLIVEEMARLKADYPHLSFFVIESRDGLLSKTEVYPEYLRREDESQVSVQQLSLW